MSENKNINAKSFKIIISLFSIGVMFHLGDIFFDMTSGEVALQECGEGNVKAVSTKGYFKHDISCFSGEKDTTGPRSNVGG